jgi:cytochrome c oxidase subunit I
VRKAYLRKPIFGYPVMVAATVCIGFVSLSVWAHHMFTIGMNSYANSFFTLTTMVVGIPTGIKIFNWIGTMWGGRIQLKTPMLFNIGFLFQFLIAGLTGIMMAAAPFDWQLSLSYFVAAHFHYVIAGGILFALFAAFYYWYPKMTGRMLSERLGKWYFGLFLIGFHLTFDVMRVPGILGMPRRIYTYEPGRGWDTLNFIVSCSWQTSSFLISREPQRVTIPGTRGHWNGPSVRRPQHVTLRRFQPWRVAARCGTRSIPRIPIAAMSERTI